jgi:hypothetical protein
MMAFAGYMNTDNDGFQTSGSIGRVLPAIFNHQTLETAKAEAPFIRDVWLPDLQVMAARSKAGTPAGLYLAAKGGHNNESHNHNDVGTFIVYYNGEPVLIDVGVETYTRKTFSSQRYEIWTMQSAYHNLPTIGAIMQAPGRKHAATNVVCTMDDKYARLQLDIADAYPGAASVKTWKRTIELERGIQVSITDDFRLLRENEVNLSLMTPLTVNTSSSGKILLSGNGKYAGPDIKILYDTGKLEAGSEEIRITDRRLKNTWGDRLFRIMLKSVSKNTGDKWSVKIQPER